MIKKKGIWPRSWGRRAGTREKASVLEQPKGDAHRGGVAFKTQCGPRICHDLGNNKSKGFIGREAQNKKWIGKTPEQRGGVYSR